MNCAFDNKSECVYMLRSEKLKIFVIYIIYFMSDSAKLNEFIIDIKITVVLLKSKQKTTKKEYILCFLILEFSLMPVKNLQ